MEMDGTIFRSCTNIEKITIGDNCSISGTHSLSYSCAETIDITCGKNTSLELNYIVSKNKNINVQNATFNNLRVTGATINGDLIVNKDGSCYCNSSKINGELIVEDNANITANSTTVTGITTLGNDIKIRGEATFDNFTSPEIKINGTLNTDCKYQQMGNCTKLPARIEISKDSLGIGGYGFRNTNDIEYLTINPTPYLKIGDAIFMGGKKVKAVIVKLSDEYTMDEFESSIGVNVNGGWLNRMSIGIFSSEPVEDIENNRLIYYSTNLTNEKSQVLDLIRNAGL